MSLGHTASAPASTCETAVRTISSREASLSTSSPLRIAAPSCCRRTPQWPCDVYSHRQTSPSRSSSGKRGRSARSARWTMPSSSHAPDPSSSFSSGIPNRITAFTPSRTSSSHSRTTSSTLKRDMPGSSSFRCPSGATKSGITKSSSERLVSRTSDRRGAVRRRRRNRVAGNELMRYSLRRRSQRKMRHRLSPQVTACYKARGGLDTAQPSRVQAADGEACKCGEHESEADEPRAFTQQRRPRREVVERAREEADRMRERQRVADPAGGGNDLAGDQAEEDDRQHDEHGHEGRRAGFPRQCADQRADCAHGRAREQRADDDERQPRPRLAAFDVSELDGRSENERNREPERSADERRERDLRRHQLPQAHESTREPADHVLVALRGE